MNRKIIMVISVFLVATVVLVYMVIKPNNKDGKDEGAVILIYEEFTGDENTDYSNNTEDTIIDENDELLWIVEDLVNEGKGEFLPSEDTVERREWYANEVTVKWNDESVVLISYDVMGDPNVSAKITLEALCEYYDVRGYVIPIAWMIEETTAYTYIIEEVSDYRRRFEINNYTLEIIELE